METIFKMKKYTAPTDVFKIKFGVLKVINLLSVVWVVLIKKKKNRRVYKNKSFNINNYFYARRYTVFSSCIIFLRI